MPISAQKLLTKIDELIELGREACEKEFPASRFHKAVPPEMFGKFHFGSLSFVRSVFGEEHPYFKKLNAMKGNGSVNVEAGIGLLESARLEIEQGWLTSLRGLVAADVFSDFLEMAEHFLQQDYKDPAAVMIGSVLEEHLRQLCTANKIPLEINQNGNLKGKKADTLNSDLTKADVYGKLDQKAVTFWLDLRNKAAHGHYAQYTKEQVVLMLQGVRDFILRKSI